MSRRRGGRRHARLGWPTLVFLVLAVGLVFAPPPPSSAAAFSTVDAPRSAAVPVVADESGLLGLAVAANVSVGSTERLVTVSNHLDVGVAVTVAVRGDSTDIGDLVVDGSAVGDATTFSVASGGQETVSVAVVNDSALAGRTLGFDVSVDESGLGVEALNRTTAVVE